jgi:hypothetical protein
MGIRCFSHSYRIAASFFILTTLGAFWFASSAEAQIVVSSPTEMQTRRLQSWYENHMPIPFRAHSRLVVREFNDAQMNAYLKGNEDDPDSGGVSAMSHTGDDGDGDIDGVFESDPDRIALRLPSAGDLDTFTFAHEYGHYVWFHLFSKDDRKRYEHLYDHQRMTHHLVTRYAETDLEEGFAEAFSFYVCEPLMLTHRDALSSQFLSRWAAQTRI